jgi:hypothetical protein
VREVTASPQGSFRNTGPGERPLVAAVDRTATF